MSPALFISLFQSTNPRLCNKLPPKSIFSSTGKVENKTNKSETDIWLCLIASHFLPPLSTPRATCGLQLLFLSHHHQKLPTSYHQPTSLRVSAHPVRAAQSRVGEVRRGVGNVEHFFARDLLLSVHVNFLSKLAHLPL